MYLEAVKTWFSALKMGLTGIAAWSAQASDRARSIPMSIGILRPDAYIKY
jgi:hypothetical protein